MKAIVHIGAPKTGSSSIQEFLFLNHVRLAQQGFRFHRNVDGRGSQYEYALAAMTRTDMMIPGEVEQIRYYARTIDEQRRNSEPYVRELEKFPKRWKEPVAIFSSEHFLPWLSTPKAVSALHEMFSNIFDDVRYVVYFRSQFDSIVSSYSERVKRGLDITLDEFITRRLKRLNIFGPANRWLNVVGRENLEVRLLDRSFLHGGDVIHDFCHVCGISFDGLEMPPRVNESLSATGAECMRALNRWIPEVHPGGGENPLRKNLLDCVADLTQDGPKLVLRRPQKARISAAVEKSNERFRKTFFPDRDVLFPESAPVNPPLNDAKIRFQALDAMAQVVIKLRLNDLPALSRLERQRSVSTTPSAMLPPPRPGEAARPGASNESRQVTSKSLEDAATSASPWVRAKEQRG